MKTLQKADLDNFSYLLDHFYIKNELYDYAIKKSRLKIRDFVCEHEIHRVRLGIITIAIAGYTNKHPNRTDANTFMLLIPPPPQTVHYD
jgi:hypothetical protein